MLVISAGMQKAGSGYIYNLLHDLLTAAGCADARDIKARYGLGTVMRQNNNNIGALRPGILLRLWWLSVREKPFVVKTHSSPNRAAKLLAALGLIKIIYIYRDPRDALLSAMDHGQKILREGKHHTFATMADFDAALENVRGWVRTCGEYHAIPNVLCVRYEDLLADPDCVLDTMEVFLGLAGRVSAEERQALLWRYSRENPEGTRTGLHFNKARALRYKTEMSPEQLCKCRSALGPALQEIGYSLD